MTIACNVSLLHTPIDLDFETDLDPGLKSWLAFSKTEARRNPGPREPQSLRTHPQRPCARSLAQGKVDGELDVRCNIDRPSFSLRHLRTGGTLVTVVALTDVRPTSGLTIDFVVEADRAQLTEIVDRIRDGRLRTNIGKVSPLNDVVATFNATERRAGKAIICARP
jgi:hypothetical protein